MYIRVFGRRLDADEFLQEVKEGKEELAVGIRKNKDGVEFGEEVGFEEGVSVGRVVVAEIFDDVEALE